jgi:hypothetical protein
LVLLTVVAAGIRIRPRGVLIRRGHGHPGHHRGAFGASLLRGNGGGRAVEQPQEGEKDE